MKAKHNAKMLLITVFILLILGTATVFAVEELQWTHFFSYSRTIYSGKRYSTESFYAPGNFTLNHTQTWKNGALDSTGTLEIRLYKAEGYNYTQVGNPKRISGNGTFKLAYNVSANSDYQLRFYNKSTADGERVGISGSCMR